jgi:hypothetical protein
MAAESEELEVPQLLAKISPEWEDNCWKEA